MLHPETAVLVLVDVQGKLAHLMHDRETLFLNLQKLIQSLQVLKVPILWLEQNPPGLGPTIPEIASLLTGLRPISKHCFSACDIAEFEQQLRATGRQQVLLAGIEAHVCIYQTARDLLARGYAVEVVTDGVSSRVADNKTLALRKLERLGAGLTSVEMAVFEMLRTAEGPRFKEILRFMR